MSDGKTFDLGVLFVHGIGNQALGSTLSECGTPLVEWLQARAARAGGRFSVGTTVLSLARDQPASSELTIVGAAGSSRWLIAESWWAQAFPIAQFRDVAGWSLLIAPWTIGTHFAKRFARTKETRWLLHRIGALTLLAGALAVSPIVLFGLAILLVLRLVPSSRLQNALASLQLAIAGWLGDSYMLVTRPIEAAAIRSRVDRDVDWMLSRCRKVAIVAHSQGGAIACQVLGQRSSRDHLLITYGSGLRKLEELAEAHERTDWLNDALLTVCGWFVATLAALFFPFVMYQVTQGTASQASAVVVLVAVALGLLLGVAGLLDFVHRGQPPTLAAIASAFSSRNIQWHDVFASVDVVPNGPLHDDGGAPPTSHRVVNLGSALQDHTSYWDSRDDFVPLVGETLLAFEGDGVLGEEDTRFARLARNQRAARIAVRQSFGWLTALSVAALIITKRQAWLNLAAWGSRRAVLWVVSLVGYVPAGLATPDAPVWADTVVPVTLVLVLAWLTRFLWGRWNDVVMRDVARGEDRQRWPIVVLVALLMQLAVAGFLVGAVGYAVVAGFAGVAFSIVMWAAAGGFVSRADDRTPRTEEPRTRSQRIWNGLVRFSYLPIELVILGAFFNWLGWRAYEYAMPRFGAGFAWAAFAVVFVLFAGSAISAIKTATRP